MARLPRLTIPNQVHHVVQKGIDGLVVFRDADDFSAFLKWLREGARQLQVAIHAYALLPGQMQLLATPADGAGLSRLMQWIGRQYVPWFNRKYSRAGTLWEGRYRATVIDADAYLMTASRFIESLPVQVGMVAEPGTYPWTSYRHHAGIQADPLITDHPLYWRLGNTPFDREIHYRTLMEQALTLAEIQQLHEGASKGWILGSAAFQQQMSKLTDRRVKPLRRGRPRKTVPNAGS